MGPAMAMAMGASRLCGRGTRTRVAASSVRLAGSCPNHPATSFHGSRCRHSHNDDTSAAGVLPVLLARAASHPGGSVATLCARGETTYAQLLRDSEHVSAALQRRVGGSGGCVDLRGARVAFLCPPGRAYIGALWGTWRAGGVTVPLCTTHPAEELRYVLQDCGASVVLVDDEHRERLAPLAAEMSVPLVCVDDALREGTEAGEEGTAEVVPVVVEHTRRAHVVYTSGTTGRPKAVVHTHQALGHQVSDLVHAWEWQAEDRILHFLPLHHSHGIINKLCCPLWAGATVEFLPRYSAAAVWRRLLLPVQQRRETCSSVSCPPINVLMAVPTIYSQLIEAWDECLSDQEREDARVACAGIRLMVSGSASLPLATLWRWHEISGHVLLERYGMTEFAMALSNPLSEPARRPGFVGAPLPSMEVKVCAEEDEDEAVAATTVAAQQLGGEVAVPHVPVPVGEAGELRVRGPGVFREYLGQPAATAAAFDAEGWFCTGDIARYDQAEGMYQILGRSSVDIVKTGGHKVSALEVERAMLEHARVAEAVVLGVADDVWGERLVALVRLRDHARTVARSKQEDSAVDGDDAEWLRTWLRGRVASEKVPREVRLTAAIPKNAMGKVNKKQLRLLFGP